MVRADALMICYLIPSSRSGASIINSCVPNGTPGCSHGWSDAALGGVQPVEKGHTHPSFSSPSRPGGAKALLHVHNAHSLAPSGASLHKHIHIRA